MASPPIIAVFLLFLFPVMTTPLSPDSCVRYGVVEGGETPSGLCKKVLGSVPEEGELVEGYTLLMTTYKGHVTLRHTVGRWREAGFLTHPKLKQIVVHINRCSCNDTRVIKELLGGGKRSKIRLKIICSKENRLHPFAMLSGLLEVRTRQVLFTENDRPTMRRTGETVEGLKERVRIVLDLALETSESLRTPYVIIHRMGMSEADVDMYQKWKIQNERKVTKQPIELTRPHQQNGDITDCWKTCVDVADPEDAEQTLATCKKLQHVYPTKENRCKVFACREWLLWNGVNGTGGGGLSGAADDPKFRELMCHIVWLRNPGPPSWFKSTRIVRFQKSPFLSCTRSAHWVNAPTIFDTRWYYEAVAGKMCSTRHDMFRSGLVYTPKKPHFGHYGRKMEQYLIRNLAGSPVCHTDGITEHIEYEDYLTDGVK